MVDLAARSVEGAFSDDPHVAAAIHSTLGKIYTQLATYDAADHHLVEALRRLDDVDAGLSTHERIDVLGGLSQVRRVQGRYEEAEGLLVETIEHARELEEPDSLGLANLYVSLGNVLIDMRRADEAQLELERALAIYDAHPDVDPVFPASVKNDLANLKVQRGDYAGAEPLYREAVAIKEHLFGPDAIELSVDLSNLGQALTAQEKYDEAREVLDRALAIKERVLGPEHPEVAYSLAGRGELAMVTGDPATAVDHIGRAAGILRAKLPADHPHLLIILTKLGRAQERHGDLDAAEERYREVLPGFVVRFGDGSRESCSVRADLARCLAATDRHAEAAALLRTAIDASLSERGETEDVVALLEDLASSQRALGDVEGAMSTEDRAAGIAGRVGSTRD